MAELRYETVPTASQFKKDSSVLMAIRSHDRLITYLDWLLERYHANHRANTLRPHVIACDLFLTCNSWITLYHERRPSLRKERYPAVLALFDVVVYQLALMFGHVGNRHNGKSGWHEFQVRNEMAKIFGREIVPEKDQSDRGITDDGAAPDPKKMARYYEKAELAQHRVRFSDGRAHQYAVRRNHSVYLKPIDSRDCYVKCTRPGAAECIPGWGSFVMTLDRVFYMSAHHSGIFHSAYTNGQPVSCAGTMLIENGVVLGIRPDSGHYTPEPKNIAFALLALKMYGVNIDRVRVLEYDAYSNGAYSGNKKGKHANQHLQQNVDWRTYTNQPAFGIAGDYA